MEAHFFLLFESAEYHEIKLFFSPTKLDLYDSITPISCMYDLTTTQVFNYPA